MMIEQLLKCVVGVGPKKKVVWPVRERFSGALRGGGGGEVA